MSASTPTSELAEAKTSTTPNITNPYPVNRDSGQLQSMAQLILKEWIKNNPVFVDGPNLNGARSLHVQRQDLVSTIDGELVRAALKHEGFDDIRTSGMFSNALHNKFDNWLKFKPEEVERANHSPAGFIFYKDSKMPATKYMINHFHDRSLTIANDELIERCLPHLEPKRPEYDVSQVIPTDDFRAHVIALRIFLTRWFENGTNGPQPRAPRSRDAEPLRKGGSGGENEKRERRKRSMRSGWRRGRSRRPQRASDEEEKTRGEEARQPRP